VSTNDDKVELVTLENARNERYGEIFVITQSGVEVYNTTGVNDCPAELWDALDLEALKQEHGALSVQKNGPHFWMMDWQQPSMGEKASFGGKIYTPAKKQEMIYSKGKPVMEASRE